MGLGEVMVKPTTMLYRNLLAMDVEELLRSNCRWTAWCCWPAATRPHRAR